MNRVIIVIFLAAGIVLMVAGCSSAAASRNANDIEIALKEYAIGTGEIRLTKSEGSATLTFKNKGMSAHNFVIPELGIDSGLIQPGDSVTLDIDAKEEKVIQAKCTLPGHTEAGMVTKVIIGK